MIGTGGSRGIGAATARLGAQRGYAVCVHYRSDRPAAEELAKGIGGIAVAAVVSHEADAVPVNGVLPGVIHTGIHAQRGDPGRVARIAESAPLKRGGQPEEVARAILWLLSDEASYTTGSFIDVTGGR